MLRRGGLLLISFDHPWNRAIGPMGHALRAAVLSRFGDWRVRVLQPHCRDEDLDALTELIEAGAVRPVVDRTFPMVDTAQAVDHLATRRARGKVIVIP